MLRPTFSLVTPHLRRLPLLALVALPMGALQPGCANDHYHVHYYYDSTGGSGGSGGGSGSGGSSGSGGGGAGGNSSVGGTSSTGMFGAAGEGGSQQPEYPGAPVANAEVDEHELDIFGVVGNRYWF